MSNYRNAEEGDCAKQITTYFRLRRSSGTPQMTTFCAPLRTSSVQISAPPDVEQCKLTPWIEWESDGLHSTFLPAPVLRYGDCRTDRRLAD
jgi:hypothetical protein